MCIDCGQPPTETSVPAPLIVLGGHDLSRETITATFDATPELRDALLARKDAQEAAGVFVASAPAKAPCPCEQAGNCPDAETAHALSVAEGEGMPAGLTSC